MRAVARVPVGALSSFCLVLSLSFLSRSAGGELLDPEGDGEEDPLASLREQPLDLLADPLAPLDEVEGAPPDFARRAEEARSRRPFHRLEDLLVVPGVDGEFLARIGPLVQLPRRAPRLRGRVVVRATAGDLAGGARAAETFAFRRGDGLGFGGAVDRDAGEEGLADSWTLWAEGRRGAVRLLLGDFNVDWGRGLALSTAFPPWGLEGRARRAVGPARGVTPHRGTGEERHLTGAAVDARLGLFRVEALASSTRRDARVGRDGRVTSLVGTGLHRSESERAARDRLLERMAALRVGIGLPGGGTLSAAIRASSYDPSLAPRTSTSLPAGESVRLTAIDFLLPLGPARLSGEAAARDEGGAARLLALEAGSGRLRVGALGRRLDPMFRPIHAASPARFDRTANEQGILLWGEARVRALRLGLARDAWGEVAGRAPGAPPARGEELALRATLSGEAAAATARATRRVERGAEDVVVRDALGLALDRALGRGFAAHVAASAIARGDGGRDAERGRAVQTALSFAGRSGLSVAIALTRYAGDSGSVVPRAAEAILPGVVRLVALGSGQSPSGWRALASARRSLGPALRLAASLGIHAPRGGPARSDVSLSLELGGAGGARRTGLTLPASDH